MDSRDYDISWGGGSLCFVLLSKSWSGFTGIIQNLSLVSPLNPGIYPGLSMGIVNFSYFWLP